MLNVIPRHNRGLYTQGYFGIRDIGLYFFRETGIFVFFYFGIWDIQEFGDMGYWNLFWDTS